MKHKVLGSVFVLAAGLGMIGVAVRAPRATAPAGVKAAVSDPIPASVAAEAAPVASKHTPNLARASASYRVYESGIERGMDFRGAGYTAQVAETGVRFGTSEGSLLLGTPRLVQGTTPVQTAAPTFAHAAFGVARLERGAVTEEYVFENSRMEQLFRIPARLGDGALTVSVPVSTTFPSVAETRVPNPGKFDSVEFQNGGVAFLDPAGALKFACYGAVVFDAVGNRLTLAPRHENNEIVMEVPATFMAKAVYPVVVDPWFTSTASGISGGVSNTGTTSQRPAMRDNVVAWADSIGGNWEIFVKIWNGSSFVELAGSASGGGISANVGQSTSPSVAVDGSGSPTVAWVDTTGSAFSIYLKQFPSRGKGTAWQELAGSATSLGLNGTFSASSNPSVGLLTGLVPGQVTVNPGTGVVTSDPPQIVICPVVAWDSGNIYVSAFYPGAPAIPSIGGSTPIAAVPPGWYQLGALNGLNVNKDTFNGSLTPSLGVGGAYPSLVVDGLNQVTIAWESVGSGNYEILASRWTLPALPPSTNFQVVGTASGQLNMFPQSNFRGIAGAGLFDNVSNNTSMSQYPSLAQNFLGDLYIAWQETEGALPGPGTSSQIYLRRSVGGGAWAGFGGSDAAGGISRSGILYDGGPLVPPVPGNASTPSVDCGLNYVGVAWADTSNGRSAIYVRRALMTGGTWDQIGFQGSAFPARQPIAVPPAVPEQAPIGGVSQSANFAYQPQITMNGDDPFVVWADGSGSTFDILSASFFPNGPGIAAGIGTTNPTFQLQIRQTETDPSAGVALDVPVAGFSVGDRIFLSSPVFTETLSPAGSPLRLEFEIQQAGDKFELKPNYWATPVVPDAPPTTLPAPPPTSLCVLEFQGLPNTNYHYITRSIDQQNRCSPWIIAPNVGGVSFRINSAATGGPPNTTPVVAGTGTKGKGSCGLLGLEAAALLGLLRLIRRKRSK